MKSDSRRFFLRLTTGASILFLSSLFTGCASFKNKKNKETHEQELNDDDKEANNNDVFESERKNQDELSEFLAQNGRKTKEKKSVVRPGDDFLLSGKAKEIYANTER